MTRSRAFPPQPSVEHLTTIFRRIDSGKIVVPAFQRTFVWELDNVLELLESVYSGYPIGSVLLWAADHEFLRVSDSPEIPFPKSEPQFPLSYVLDGLQRLSSLYGVFHFEDKTNQNIFDVSFDILSQRFLPPSEIKDHMIAVPLNAVFNPRRLLEVQRRLIEGNAGDDTLSKLTDLQSRFQEYMIPLVTLADRSLEEVVVIFERVNSTGTRLSRVDFMRAITWSENFDLNQALDTIKEMLEDQEFDLADDTIVKALGLMYDLDPLPDVLLALRQQTATSLSKSVLDVVSVFKRVFAFLREKLSIFSSEFIPYEGQMLVLFRIFRDRRDLSTQQTAAVKSWFFYVSFEEALQGRPDNFVARMIKATEAQIVDGRLDLPVTKIDSERFIRRRMLKGKALTTAFVTMMADLNPRSLRGNVTIRTSSLTGTYEAANFVPILSLNELISARGRMQSARIPANVIISSPDDLPIKSDLVKEIIFNDAKTPEGRELLSRQLINDEAIVALAGSKFRLFLEVRARLMADRATSMINT
jgi:hypothetical protein